MARARNIKPGFFKNEDLAECSVWARLLFPGLWMLADREGRLENRPKRIKGEIFPFDNVEVQPLLDELENWKFIKRYEVCGVKCIQILSFIDHQSPHGTEKDSELPCENGFLTVNERNKGSFVTGNAKAVPYGEPLNNGIEGGSSPTNNDAPTVNPPLDTGAITVDPPFDNALNPDSLNPDSLIPDSHTACASACDPKPSPGQICKAMKQAGVSDVNPGNPTLRTLIDAGATLDEFTGAAAKAVADGKGFAYSLGIVRREREQAAQMAAGLLRGPLPNTAPQQRNTNRYAGAAAAIFEDATHV
jgi:hypothetical protein